MTSTTDRWLTRQVHVLAGTAVILLAVYVAVGVVCLTVFVAVTLLRRR